MKEVDFTQKASLGQYLPGRSALHRLIPQVKLGLTILILSGILVTSPVLGSLFAVFFLLVAGQASGVSGRFLLGNVLPILPFLCIIALMQLFFTRAGNSPILYGSGRFTITLEGLLSSTAIFLRFLAVMVLLTLFTSITPSREIGHGTENLAAPLARLGFPSHEFSLIVTITFRFIPILTREAENIMKAQASRGALLGSERNPLKRITSYIPLLVPLFVQALERAEQLAQAMEARCYEQGRERSRYVSYHFSRRDGILLFSGLLFTGLLFYFRLARWEYILFELFFIS